MTKRNAKGAVLWLLLVLLPVLAGWVFMDAWEAGDARPGRPLAIAVLTLLWLLVFGTLERWIAERPRPPRPGLYNPRHARRR